MKIINQINEAIKERGLVAVIANEKFFHLINGFTTHGIVTRDLCEIHYADCVTEKLYTITKKNKHGFGDVIRFATDEEILEKFKIGFYEK